MRHGGFQVHHSSLSSTADRIDQHSDAVSSAASSSGGIRLSHNAQGSLAANTTSRANEVYGSLSGTMNGMASRLGQHAQQLRTNNSRYQETEENIARSFNDIDTTTRAPHVNGGTTSVASGSGSTGHTVHQPPNPHGNGPGGNGPGGNGPGGHGGGGHGPGGTGGPTGTNTAGAPPLSAQWMSEWGVRYNQHIWQNAIHANEQRRPTPGEAQVIRNEIDQFMANGYGPPGSGPGAHLGAHGFTVTGGTQPYDPVVRRNNGRPTSYDGFYDHITANGHDSRTEAAQLNQWANGQLPFAQLPPHVQDIAVITHFAENGRGYHSAVNEFDNRVGQIAGMNSPAEANAAWHDLIHSSAPPRFYPAAHGDSAYRPDSSDDDEPYSPTASEIDAEFGHHSDVEMGEG